MVLICLGAIVTTATIISIFAFITILGSSREDSEAGIGWWGFINTIFAVMLGMAWMQYGMNRHWENHLKAHGRGEFVQKQSQNGPYLEFQLVPPVPPTKEPLTLINPEAKQ